VGDNTPPKLNLPGTVVAFATSRLGAKVSYTVTATDNSDPMPVVACKPPSGSQFPLGKTTVNCTATDKSGNKSSGSFLVKVIVDWSGPLPPIKADGSSLFLRNQSIKVRFNVQGASAQIKDLKAFLFIAPLDAAGNPGKELQAPCGTSNQFRFVGPYAYELSLNLRNLALGPWRLRYDLGDGELHTVKITLVKTLPKLLASGETLVGP
jgi:hypothetical protein